jgi:hypothetical protein
MQDLKCLLWVISRGVGDDIGLERVSSEKRESLEKVDTHFDHRFYIFHLFVILHMVLFVDEGYLICMAKKMIYPITHSYKGVIELISPRRRGLSTHVI